MDQKLRNGIALSLIPQIILVKWLGHNPEWVEQYYSMGLYPKISGFFRFLFGWIPFSLGEIIYTLLIFSAIYYCYWQRRQIKSKPFIFLKNAAMVFAVFYFTFHLLWGLNYYRQPIAQNLAIRDSITKVEVLEFTKSLISKTNAIQFKITGDTAAIVQIPYEREAIFDKTIKGFGNLEKQYPFLKYQRPSIKKSMYSTFSTYLGIGGYLNPFTNEAQVNALIPLFRFPVVVGHEVGHQVGYSAENETNFIGYLVTLKNEDPYFQYSAYAFALSHCLIAIARSDESEFDQLYAQLNDGVKKNYRELNAFYAQYENPIEPLFQSAFNTFLKANNQADGVQSYGKVVNLMVGYHTKYPI